MFVPLRHRDTKPILRKSAERRRLHTGPERHLFRGGVGRRRGCLAGSGGSGRRATRHPRRAADADGSAPPTRAHAVANAEPAHGTTQPPTEMKKSQSSEEDQDFTGWGTWTRTKNKGTRNLRVANYTIPQGLLRKQCSTEVQRYPIGGDLPKARLPWAVARSTSNAENVTASRATPRLKAPLREVAQRTRWARNSRRIRVPALVVAPWE